MHRHRQEPTPTHPLKTQPIPDRRPLRWSISLRREGYLLLSGNRPPGKAMVGNTMAAPAPGSPEKTSVSAEVARGERAPSPATRQGVQGGRVVFVDFGRGKVYAVTADGEEVYTFDSIEDLVGKLSPNAVVIDSLPGKLQKSASELATTGITFLRLKNLEKISEERKNNGVKKTDENDVRLLKTLYRRHPDLFQPISTSPEELEVRALTELWVEIARMKKASKQTRMATNNPVVAKINKTLRNSLDELSREIHEEALSLPLYRKAVQGLGLKGPTLAYIISHDGWAFTVLPRDRLAIRYQLTRRVGRGRRLRSRLLIMLAFTTVVNKHPRYITTYEDHRQKGKKHWSAVLRVAQRILRELSRIAKESRRQTLDT